VGGGKRTSLIEPFVGRKQLLVRDGFGLLIGKGRTVAVHPSERERQRAADLAGRRRRGGESKLKKAGLLVEVTVPFPPMSGCRSAEEKKKEGPRPRVRAQKEEKRGTSRRAAGLHLGLVVGEGKDKTIVVLSPPPRVFLKRKETGAHSTGLRRRKREGKKVEVCVGRLISRG